MKDEMCNFYTMYYYDADQPDAMNPGENCGEIDDRIFDQMPADSDQPLPDAGGMKMEMKRQLGKHFLKITLNHSPREQLVENITAT